MNEQGPAQTLLNAMRGHIDLMQENVDVLRGIAAVARGQSQLMNPRLRVSLEVAAHGLHTALGQAGHEVEVQDREFWGQLSRIGRDRREALKVMEFEAHFLSMLAHDLIEVALTPADRERLIESECRLRAVLRMVERR